MRQMPTGGEQAPEDDEKAAMRAFMQQYTAPRSVVREGGRLVGVQHGDIFRPVVRDASGQITGLQ